MSLKDKKYLIEQLNIQKITVPKEYLLQEIFESIKNIVLYICKMIEDSPEQEDGIADYVYEYLFESNILELGQENLVNFADEIYLFSEKIKMKLLNLTYIFEDEDWYEFKNILERYEDL